MSEYDNIQMQGIPSNRVNDSKQAAIKNKVPADAVNNISRRDVFKYAAWGAGLLALTSLPKIDEAFGGCSDSSKNDDLAKVLGLTSLYGGTLGWERLEQARVTVTRFYEALDSKNIDLAMQEIALDYKDEEGDRMRLQGAIETFLKKYETLSMTPGDMRSLTDDNIQIDLDCDTTVTGLVNGEPAKDVYRVTLSLRADSEGILRITYIRINPGEESVG